MWRARSLLLAIAIAATLPVVAHAQQGSPTERKRREIQQQLGLPKTPPKAAPPPPQEPEAAPATATAAPGTAEAPPQRTVFQGAVHNLLLSGCRSCHSQGGSAAQTRFVLRGARQTDYKATRAFVDPAQPRRSLLIIKTSGEAHAGGLIYGPKSRQYRQILAWIIDGAELEVPATSAARVAEVPQPGPAQPSQARVRAPSPPSIPPAAVLPPPPIAPVAGPPAKAPTIATAPDFTTTIHPLLQRGCVACHNPAGNARGTRLLFPGAVDADFQAIRPFLSVSRPTESPLLTKGAGAAHGGGEIYAADSDAYRTLVAWIAAGAPRVPSLPGAPPAAPMARAPAEPSATPTPLPSAPPPSPLRFRARGAHHGGPGIGLPFGFHLNGRFDLNYERRALGRDSSWGAGRNGLRSYHQFLFLTRPGGDDFPIGLSVELIQLQIWEASFAHRFEGTPLSIVVRGGKMLVPFGAEPLFHQLYGGLVGFDQKVLLPVWAQEGLSEQLVARLGSVSLSSELFAVRGYRLKSPDGVLNLQNDFSPIDEAKLGVGHRLGVSWLRLAGWYSIYFNPLGAGPPSFAGHRSHVRTVARVAGRRQLRRPLLGLCRLSAR